MRQVIIFIILALTFFGISRVVLTSFSPFDMAKVEEIITKEQIEKNEFATLDTSLFSQITAGKVFAILSPSFYITVALISISLFFGFSAAHIFFDKLFFKDYFEKASRFDAFRRGVLFASLFPLTILMRLFYQDQLILLLIVILIILIEIFFSLYVRKWLLTKYYKFREFNQKFKEEVSS